MGIIPPGNFGQTRPHLLALAIAISVLVVAAVAGRTYAESVERRYIYALAPVRFTLKYVGSALQRQALQQADLLPLYGSSELEIPDPFHASKIFGLYPSGFTVFTIGGYGTESLIYVQRIAAAEGDLRGKKVVISLAPEFFTPETYWSGAYAANFSPLQAYETAFSTEFSYDLKQHIARRMLAYPETLEQDPLLELTLEALADKSPWSAWRYYPLVPLGEFKLVLLQLQDHWNTLNWIYRQRNLDPAVARRPGVLHWQGLLSHADQSYSQHANNNPFGFDNSQWDKSSSEWLGEDASLTNDEFVRTLNESEGWVDLGLLLKGLRAAGARPLIISMPFPGRYMDYVGISAASRQVYYDKLRETVSAYGMPLVELEAYDEDADFLWNPSGHLSSRGWVIYSEAIDAFYHDRPLPTH